ncbi:TPA: hypothetical protein DHU97_03305 [Candidatus Saccharibacteria bacterium]|nr:hypothetical protein [Candidatus Saccharibacteria bacterium]
MLDALTAETVPWDFRGREFQNAQRGTGGYYLCSDCNSRTGRETVPAYLEMIRQTRAQNVIPLELQWARGASWQVSLHEIEPNAIARQVILMIACMNNHTFVRSKNLLTILLDKHYRPKKFEHGLYVFINAGALSVSYPAIVLGGLHGKMSVVTGVFTGTYSFQMELDQRTNPHGYADISNWITDFAHGETASIDLHIPILETNVGLPGAHQSRAEILQNLEQHRRSQTAR